MLMTPNDVSGLIKDNRLLHIAGAENALRQLPRGKWVGGSTEYFVAHEGGRVSDELLFVTQLTDVAKDFTVRAYTPDDISKVTGDAYDNGFSIVIVPFDSDVHKVYARNAAGFKGMFLKNITGWVSGFNLNKPGQYPVTVNGITGEVYTDKAVALHVEVPDNKTAIVNIVNIFEQDESSPVIEFKDEGFEVTKCLVDGKEVMLADYIADNNINTELPLVGDYSGNGINISFKSIDEDGTVHFYAPVFTGIKYRIARSISDYKREFNTYASVSGDINAAFSCNCILNFLYGGLEGKTINSFKGPVTFGEIAYQLVNQTLVYVIVE